MADEDRVEVTQALYRKATLRPWEMDSVHDSDAEYGGGEDPDRGFNNYEILGPDGLKILGTEDAAHKEIDVDQDEDGGVYAWDAVGRANAELVIYAVNNIERVEAENTELRTRLSTPQASPDTQLREALERLMAAVKSLGETPPGRRDNYHEAPLEAVGALERWQELDAAVKSGRTALQSTPAPESAGEAVAREALLTADQMLAEAVREAGNGLRGLRINNLVKGIVRVRDFLARAALSSPPVRDGGEGL